ncbi:hypothetical protein ZWY2020_027671 [Hordeum vulgare]|nr:hypothetical protein ZWY2020_027671 [Hordeum vulgare]
MYEDNRSCRRKDNLESSLTIDNLTEEKNKIEGNYGKLVQDVHELFNFQEDRMMDFNYLNDRMKGVEVTNSVVSDMKTKMEKKDAEISDTPQALLPRAEISKLQEKYKVLMNLSTAKATIIRNLKAKHLQEKEQLSEASKNLQLKVDKLNQSQEKFTEENSKLKLHIGDQKKGHERLTVGSAKLKLQIADLVRLEERTRQKLKGIQDILSE